jgi:hypothetical protein
MTKPWVQFESWEYEEEIRHFEISASNGSYAASQDFYESLTSIEEFGRALKAFPRSAKDEVRLEIGSRGQKSAYWLLLRAYLYDATGHAALLFEACNNTIDPWREEARFTIRCEVASLNRLGAALVDWARNGSGCLREELSPAGM